MSFATPTHLLWLIAVNGVVWARQVLLVLLGLALFSPRKSFVLPSRTLSGAGIDDVSGLSRGSGTFPE